MRNESFAKTGIAAVVALSSTSVPASAQQEIPESDVEIITPEKIGRECTGLKNKADGEVCREDRENIAQLIALFRIFTNAAQINLDMTFGNMLMARLGSGIPPFDSADPDLVNKIADELKKDARYSSAHCEQMRKDALAHISVVTSTAANSDTFKISALLGKRYPFSSELPSWKKARNDLRSVLKQERRRFEEFNCGSGMVGTSTPSQKPSKEPSKRQGVRGK